MDSGITNQETGRMRELVVEVFVVFYVPMDDWIAGMHIVFFFSQNHVVSSVTSVENPDL